jgi:ThiF family
MTNPNVFKRVVTAYDLPRMKCSRIIAVGCGGARSFLEDMARCGVGQFVLIDPDVVEEPNIATQQVYVEEIGRAKVDCIADRILQINPDTYVETYQMTLDDIDDFQFALHTTLWHISGATGFWAGAPEPFFPPLLCGFTDNFYAQARVNRLALQFGLPSLCAGLYQYGQAGEITFTYPGVTPACQRCILSPRYKAYLERGYQNDVTSAGSPIFATQRVNSLKGMIALALLHHGTGQPVWGDMLSRIGNRTLVQIRMHPDAQYKAFSKVLSGADTERLFFDEAVWLPQEADPNCPECKGTGDLRAAKGTFADTRIMPGQADHVVFKVSSADAQELAGAFDNTPIDGE